MDYNDKLMKFNLSNILDEAEAVEKYIYDLLADMISNVNKTDNAIKTSSRIIVEINKLDSIVNELCMRVDSCVSEINRLNEPRRTTTNHLEEGKSKLEKFKFADASDGPITEEFNAEDLVALMEDVLCDDCEEDDCAEEYEDSDFHRLVKDFIGNKIKCD